jgi:hypothetical protein
MQNKHSNKGVLSVTRCRGLRLLERNEVRDPVLQQRHADCRHAACHMQFLPSWHISLQPELME